MAYLFVFAVILAAWGFGIVPFEMFFFTVLFGALVAALSMPGGERA